MILFFKYHFGVIHKWPHANLTPKPSFSVTQKLFNLDEGRYNVYAVLKTVLLQTRSNRSDVCKQKSIIAWGGSPTESRRNYMKIQPRIVLVVMNVLRYLTPPPVHIHLCLVFRGLIHKAYLRI